MSGLELGGNYQMTNNKPWMCKEVFCGNPICKECPDKKYCAIHKMIKELGIKKILDQH